MMAGTYGKLFDSNVDKFGEGNWQVFEMEKIMENEAIVGPTLDYLFHRIEGQLTGEPVLIILDECWLFLRNKAFRKKIIEYIKDLRKKNASSLWLHKIYLILMMTCFLLLQKIC